MAIAYTTASEPPRSFSERRKDMTKNFKAVIETLSEVGYYLAFAFLL